MNAIAGRNSVLAAIVIASIVLAVAGTAAAETLYVPDDYATIQEAIDAAVSGEDQIEVAPGWYNEAIDFEGKAVWLYSAEGPGVTSIDATGLTGVYHVVQCVSDEGPDTVLEGFTITGGNANGSASSDRSGGGMYNLSSSPTVTNCTFTGNRCTWLGGGMCNERGSPTVTNCTFTDNTVWYGGGGMCNYLGSSTVTNCTFTGNTAVYEGGGLYTWGDSSRVTDCTFRSNEAIGEYTGWVSGLGGGMGNYAGTPTVSNCLFDGNKGRAGGGLSNSWAGATVTHCTFTGNEATAQGGGILCWGEFGGATVVSDCTLSENAAGAGGGLFSYEANLTVTNSTFSHNTADYDGGGMYNEQGTHTAINCLFDRNKALNGGGMCNYSTSPTVTDCIFRGNTATGDRGGGGMCNGWGSPTVTGCTFSGNTADVKGWWGGGGGMCNNDNSSPTVTGCSFRDNTAAVEGGGGGGGMFNGGGSSTVTNCTFSGNTAAVEGWSGAGGGVCNGGDITVTNCTFSGNVAEGQFSVEGGGMSNSGGATVTNCTFSGNIAASQEWGGAGGGVCNGGDITVTNCTFSNNTAGYGGAMENYGFIAAVVNCILWGDTPSEVDDWGGLAVSYSNVQGGWLGTGNIDTDPMFADSGGRLLAFSPCIDAGDNDVVEQDTDLDGNPRMTDGDGNGDAEVDMGAYEFQAGAVDLIKYLSRALDGLNLPKGIAGSLHAKLDAAAKKLADANKTNNVAAINDLKAFINAVKAQRGKKIPDAQADTLIGRAQQSITMLGGR